MTTLTANDLVARIGVSSLSEWVHRLYDGELIDVFITREDELNAKKYMQENSDAVMRITADILPFLFSAREDPAAFITNFMMRLPSCDNETLMNVLLCSCNRTGMVCIDVLD